MNNTSSTSAEVLRPSAVHPEWITLLLKSLVAILLVLAGLILFFFNPQQHGFYPFCIFHRMTGLLCPGCGSLRAIHELLHGHLLAALRYNPLLVVSIPMLAFWKLNTFRRPASKAPVSEVSSVWIWSAIGLLLAFGIVRNLPFFRNSLAGF